MISGINPPTNSEKPVAKQQIDSIKEQPSHSILIMPGEPHRATKKKRICWQETATTDSGKEIPILPPGHIRPRYQRLINHAFKRIGNCCAGCCDCGTDDELVPQIEELESKEEMLRRKRELYAMIFDKPLTQEYSLESLDDVEQEIPSQQ